MESAQPSNLRHIVFLLSGYPEVVSPPVALLRLPRIKLKYSDLSDSCWPRDHDFEGGSCLFDNQIIHMGEGKYIETYSKCAKFRMIFTAKMRGHE